MQIQLTLRLEKPFPAPRPAGSCSGRETPPASGPAGDHPAGCTPRAGFPPKRCWWSIPRKSPCTAITTHRAGSEATGPPSGWPTMISTRSSPTPVMAPGTPPRTSTPSPRPATGISRVSGPTASPCSWWTGWTTRSMPTRCPTRSATAARTSPWTAATTIPGASGATPTPSGCPRTTLNRTTRSTPTAAPAEATIPPETSTP